MGIPLGRAIGIMYVTVEGLSSPVVICFVSIDRADEEEITGTAIADDERDVRLEATRGRKLHHIDPRNPGRLDREGERPRPAWGNQTGHRVRTRDGLPVPRHGGE